MLWVTIIDRANLVTKLRHLWDDSRTLQIYIVVTAAMAVWIKFALDLIHWLGTGTWMH